MIVFIFVSYFWPGTWRLDRVTQIFRIRMLEEKETLEVSHSNGLTWLHSGVCLEKQGPYRCEGRIGKKKTANTIFFVPRQEKKRNTEGLFWKSEWPRKAIVLYSKWTSCHLLSAMRSDKSSVPARSLVPSHISALDRSTCGHRSDTAFILEDQSNLRRCISPFSHCLPGWGWSTSEKMYGIALYTLWINSSKGRVWRAWYSLVCCTLPIPPP